MKRFPSSSTGSTGEVLAGPVVDCHQHLWPEALVELLRGRSTPPMMRGWTLHLDGEPAYDADSAQHDAGQRRKTNVADGIDRTLYSLSCSLGLESLTPDESAPMLAAWHGLADALGDGDAIWAAPALVDPDPDELAATLAHPRVIGLQVPATAMADPATLEATAPVLAVAEAADLPVLVHPGPVPPGAGAVPSWWPALTSYTAQLQAAWFAWHVAGRALLPRLRIAYVGLAGLAPLHHERLGQRGGALGPIDPGVHYETSSYGTRAIDALVRVVGVDPLVHGSDRPYAVPTDPGLGGAFGHALFVTNPHHLLNGGTR
ncbi:MAG: putative amidohydrolase [Nocardioidaceae bacterium]|nr:putative amidohydrolase [Nocardioidaceae bacterium]